MMQGNLMNVFASAECCQKLIVVHSHFCHVASPSKCNLPRFVDGRFGDFSRQSRRLEVEKQSRGVENVGRRNIRSSLRI